MIVVDVLSSKLSMLSPKYAQLYIVKRKYVTFTVVLTAHIGTVRYGMVCVQILDKSKSTRHHYSKIVKYSLKNF